jgi:hypothetical protein
MSLQHLAMLLASIFFARVMSKAVCWVAAFGYAALAILAQWKGV